MRHFLLLIVFIILTSCGGSKYKKYKLLSSAEQNSAVVIAKVLSKDDSYLIAKNIKQNFTPASCQKIVTTLWIIKELGEGFRYTTSLFKLPKNNYAIKFSGDYMLKSEDVAELLAILKNTRINGRLLLDISEFQNSEWSPNVMIDDTQSADLAPILAAIIDKNQHSFKIIPTKKNFPANIANNDKALYASTVKTGDNTSIWVERRFNSVLINGSIAENSEEITKNIAAMNGMDFVKNKINQILKNHNIKFLQDIEFVTDKRLDFSKGQLLSEYKSLPLKFFLKKALKISDNIAFDSLYLKLVNNNYQFPKWEKGDLLIKKFLKNEYDIDASEALFADGSGISRYNRIKPSLLLQILKRAYGNELFQESLVKAEENSSTLYHRKLPKNLKAKTGSLSGISCLCGYLDYKKDPLVFVMITNNFIPPAINIRKMEDELLNSMDTYRNN